jgi:membrane associated rhomboid family serine protease
MGIYDRDYYREQPRSLPTIGGSMVTTLIAINVAVYLLDWASQWRLSTDYLALRGGLFRVHWQAWELLTYGFVHEPDRVMHILLNMFGLWIFGRDVEGVYGPVEFLRFYLSATVLAGLVWLITDGYWSNPNSIMLGASGAVMGVMMISVLQNPRRTLLLNFFLPVPAWLVMALFVAFDVMGTLSPQQDNVAHVSHLAGAAYGFLYYRRGWNLGRLAPPRWLERLTSRRPRLKVHQTDPRESSEAELDRLLEKVGREGEASLTARERSTLEEFSRRYQRRQRR